MEAGQRRQECQVVVALERGLHQQYFKELAHCQVSMTSGLACHRVCKLDRIAQFALQSTSVPNVPCNLPLYLRLTTQEGSL